MTKIYLHKNDVPALWFRLFPDYSGRKYEVEVTESVHLEDGAWSAGTRSFWRVQNGGEQPRQVAQFGTQFDETQKVDMLTGPHVVVACHRFFNGKDRGVCFYVHPDNPLLVELPECEDPILSRPEQITLAVIRSYKAAYRKDAALRFIKEEEWEQARERLKELKLLRANGAITPSGRNVIEGQIEYVQ